MTLILLPNLIGEDRELDNWFPPAVAAAVKSIDGLIAESDKAGRAYLNRFRTKKPPLQIPIALFNKQDPDNRDYLDFLLEPVEKGQRWGVLSDQGLPCIADPGSSLVRRAHQKGIAVESHVGPSSIVMALMLSGFKGQRFAFHGYLERERKRHLGDMEKRARKGETQIFMEAPYRNGETLDAILTLLRDETLLAVAWSLGGPEQGVLSMPIRRWRRIERPNLEKKPAVFLLASG